MAWPLDAPPALPAGPARFGAVRRHDKGRPTAMLHLEQYVAGVREPVWWRLGEPQPVGLLDPGPLLERLVR